MFNSSDDITFLNIKYFEWIFGYYYLIFLINWYLIFRDSDSSNQNNKIKRLSKNIN